MNSELVKREFSAGCVVCKPVTNHQSQITSHQFLLGKHSGYHKWVLPKGLIEKGEKGIETAIRETEEEMGVKAALVKDKPIYVIKYFYWADLKDKNPKFEIRNSKQIQNSILQNSKQLPQRRVEKYQEQGGGRTRVFKTVSFYLAKYVSGNPKNHGWEMEQASWFDYQTALKKLAFEGEKEALQKAQRHLELK